MWHLPDPDCALSEPERQQAVADRLKGYAVDAREFGMYAFLCDAHLLEVALDANLSRNNRRYIETLRYDLRHGPLTLRQRNHLEVALKIQQRALYTRLKPTGAFDRSLAPNRDAHALPQDAPKNAPAAPDQVSPAPAPKDASLAPERAETATPLAGTPRKPTP